MTRFFPTGFKCEISTIYRFTGPLDNQIHGSFNTIPDVTNYDSDHPTKSILGTVLTYNPNIDRSLKSSLSGIDLRNR